MTLTGIFVYPIKSMGGISLESSKLEERGLPHDRRWTLVDKDFRFISQREFPDLALFQPSLKNDHLHISYKGTSVDIPFRETAYQTRATITVWNDSIHSLIASPDINQWFSEQLNTECQLAYQGVSSVRLTPPKYAAPQEVSYADGYPFLVLSEESLDDLNKRLDAPVLMNRFRPNLVFKGGHPHIEDEFQNIKIGAVDFIAVKPCGRCQIITIDQANPSIGKEPLKTLSAYRKAGNKVLFGQNLILQDSNTENMIRIGDPITAWNPKS